MKTNKIWYLGYVIGLCSLILALTLNLNEAIKVLLIFIFAISLSVSHVQLTHHRLLEKDRDYKISMNDERNEKIRDKVNAMMTSVLISLACSPVIMLFISKYYEKKY